MGIGSWGGGIVLGLVAVLWLAYLIPSWAKRQQYLATERNAVRLQQTLRILAETSELPPEVHIEANARSVADAQKILRDGEVKREAIRRAHEAARQRAVTRELKATAPVLREALSQPALAARRLRRTRLVSTLVLVAAIVAVVAGIVTVASSVLLLVAGVVAGGASTAVLVQLAAVSRARAHRQAVVEAAPTVDVPVVAQPLQDFAPSAIAVDQDPEGRESAQRTWTPIAMPRPLYLRRGSARALARSSAVAGSPTSQGDLDALRAAAVASSEALRREQLEAQQAAQQEALREVARAEAALQWQRERARTVEPARERVALELVEESPAAVEAAVEPAAAPHPAAVAPAPPTAAQSRFARMGFLDEGETQALELDEVLRRRRAV